LTRVGFCVKETLSLFPGGAGKSEAEAEQLPGTMGRQRLVAVLELTNISKHFGIHAVNDVSLHRARTVVG
jgi:hypothetical protein